MTITQVQLVLGAIECAVLSHNTMPQKLSERAIGMLTSGMPTRAVARDMLISLPQAASNVILENLAEHPTDLTTADHV